MAVRVVYFKSLSIGKPASEKQVKSISVVGFKLSQDVRTYLPNRRPERICSPLAHGPFGF